jgi:hypothetical protein
MKSFCQEFGGPDLVHFSGTTFRELSVPLS